MTGIRIWFYLMVHSLCFHFPKVLSSVARLKIPQQGSFNIKNSLFYAPSIKFLTVALMSINQFVAWMIDDIS